MPLSAPRRPALVAVTALVVAGVAGSLWACGGEDAPTPQPATLRVSIPPPTEVAPACSAPSARLLVDGRLASCPVVTHMAAPGGPITGVELACPEAAGLTSVTPYELVVTYVQGDVVVARAPVLPAPSTLAAGANTLAVAAADVSTALDANGNGVPDLQDACP